MGGLDDDLTLGAGALQVIGAELRRPYYLALLAEAYGDNGQASDGGTCAGLQSGLRIDPERFEPGGQAFGALAFLVGALAFLLHWGGHPAPVRVIEA